MSDNRFGLRELSVATAVVAWLTWHPSSVTVAKADVDWCSDVCALDASCDEPCLQAYPDAPPLEITCGEFTGGACENTCAQLCGHETSCQTPCSGPGGVSTTCGEYGVCVQCGDGFCASTEECGSCGDCTCLAESEPITTSDMPTLCTLFDLPCPANKYASNNGPCWQKDEKLQDLVKTINIWRALVDTITNHPEWWSQGIGPGSTFFANIQGYFNAAQAEYFAVMAYDCYPLPAGG